MSHSPGNKKPESKKPESKPVSSGHISDRFRETVSLTEKKKDFRELDVGSPVSPLRTRGGGGGPTVSSSSGSSGSFSGRTGSNPASKRSDSARNNNSNSGELSGSSENSPTVGKSAGNVRRSQQGHNSRSNSGTGSHSRSNSGTGSHSGQTVNSPPVNVLPAGNICPSGKVLNTGMVPNPKSDVHVLGSGKLNYGHGSIMRGGSGVGSGGVAAKRTAKGESTGLTYRKGESNNPEELKKAGNEHYKMGKFFDALGFYDRAIGLSPKNASYRGNRAAALTGLGRLDEAVKECEEALRLDPTYNRAHHRLASLFIRLGQVENARKHLYHPGLTPDLTETQKLKMVDRHINKCADGRRLNDWKSVLRELDGAVACGADCSPQLFMCRAEALLKLHQIDDAESVLLHVNESFPQHTNSNNSTSFQAKFFGMLSEAYSYFVKAQIEMALGRFENAVKAAEKANLIDAKNVEIVTLLNNVKAVSRARVRGNDLFKSERFTEACAAYKEGLRLDPSNSVLYCNRAACWFKLGQWEKSIEDSNRALDIQPNYAKALLRRATSYNKLEKWEEAVRDYEVLRNQLPNDNAIAEALFHAQIALKKSRGEDVQNLKFGGEVEQVSSLEQFRTAISFPGVSVVHFQVASNLQCKEISQFVDKLCVRYPSINFLKVDIQESPTIATAENVRVVPTFKIYKNGSRVKEIVCPTRDVLEHSVRHYSN